MSELLETLVLKPFKIYTVEKRRYHYAYSPYFKIFESGSNPDGSLYWVIGFEDLDEEDPITPDYDYLQPKIRVTLIDTNYIQITGLEYNGFFHNKLLYGDIVVFNLTRGSYTNFGTRTIPLLDISALMLRILTSQVVNVDTLATEESVSDLIDTQTQSPPITILEPPPGKRISTRSGYLLSDSSAGTIIIRFKNSQKIIAPLFCSKFYLTLVPRISINGDVDDPIEITWDGLSPGSLIFYALSYKLV